MPTTKYEEFMKPYKEKLRLKRGVCTRRPEIAARDAIGATLAAARQNRRLSQQAVADGAGIPQAEFSRIENGLGNPTVDTLLKILTTLDLQMTLESSSVSVYNQGK